MLTTSSGNRFRDLSLPEKREWKDAFPTVRELSLASTFLTWDKVLTLLHSILHFTLQE